MEKQFGYVVSGFDHPIIGKTVVAVVIDKEGARLHTTDGHVFLFKDATTVTQEFRPVNKIESSSETRVQLRAWLRAEYNRFMTLHTQEASSLERTIGQVEALQRYARHLGDYQFVSMTVATLAHLRQQLPDVNLLKDLDETLDPNR